MQEEKTQDSAAQTDQKKTPEQIREERLKRYTDNPDNFIEITEIIAAVKWGKGIEGNSERQFFIGELPATELHIALGIIRREIDKRITMMEIATARKKGRIHIPGKGGGNGKGGGMFGKFKGRR